MSLSDKDKSHRRTVSANDASMSCAGGSNTSDSQSLCDNVPHDSVTGQTSNRKRNHFIHGLSATWSGKPPKVPQPERTQLVFRIINSGLRDIIKLTKEDLYRLKHAADATSVSSHQIKAAERYLAKLEFHLSELEELQENYEVQQKMRNGIRSMAYAYILSHGKERESALNSVHSGYKDCNNLLCSYETKLEMMMGTFMFEMIGIQGFARMCCGDVFEIVIKHGDQKWKSRGQVLRNNKQLWENKRILFKSLFNELLYIKAVEVRGLGKNVLLGNKYCETRDLFSAHPQQMTINLNPSGSLKLNIIITWNPVHGVSDENTTMHSKHLFGSQSLLHDKDPSCYKDSRASVYKELQRHMYDSFDDTRSEFSSIGNSTYTSPQSSTATSPHDNMTNCREQIGHISHPSHYVTEFSASRTSETYSPVCNTTSASVHNSHMGPSVQSASNSECNSLEVTSSNYSCQNIFKLQDVLSRFCSSFENIHEQYPELEELYDKVLEIEKILKFQRQSVFGSDVSISIKNALGCFDFLNSAIDNDEEDRAADSASTPCSEKVIASSAIDSSDATQSFRSSPQPLTSGVEQLDVALTVHLDHCLKLMERLCSTSPLKCLEIISLDKLKRHTSTFTDLLEVLRKKPKESCNLSPCEFFSGNETKALNLWIKLSSDNIVSSINHFLPELEKYVLCIIPGESSSALKVAESIVCRMLDKKTVPLDCFITVCHYKMFLLSYQSSFETYISEIATQIAILEDLKSNDSSRVKIAISKLNSVVPFTEALFEISYLLIAHDLDIKTLSTNYLEDEALDCSTKAKLTAVYLQGLESEAVKCRKCSCVALSAIHAADCAEQLLYMSQHDENEDVRHAAKLALFSFGEAERKLYLQYEQSESMTKI